MDLQFSLQMILKNCHILLKSAKIPDVVIQDIEESIEHNKLNEDIIELEKEVEFKEGPAKKESAVKDRRVNVRQRSGGQDKLKEDVEVRELKKFSD